MEEHFPIDHFLNIPQHSPNILKIGDFDQNSPPQALPSGALDSKNLDLVNKKIMEHLKGQISEVKYKTFFSNTFSLVSLTANLIKFAVSTKNIKTVIEDHYLCHIQDAVRRVLGEKYQVEITFIHPPKNPKLNQNSDIKRTSAKDASFTIDLVPTKEDKINSVNATVLNYPNNKRLNFVVDPKKTFDNFVVGPSNNMAYASAQAVANNPGNIYPCLYIYSISGLGKTHLLHSVANKAKAAFPSLIICITTARDFMTEMVDAITKNNIFSFRKKYSEEVDILMIDDVHELKNKEGTQNEFFHIFNELHNKGKQLIFTSDKHPKDINGIEERIKTRLAWGLVLDIQAPDLETRIAILKRKVSEEDIFLPQDVINLIATRVRSNIRELEGSLIRLAAYSSLFDIDIDMEIAKEQLNLADNSREQDTPSFSAISSATSQYFKVPLADMKSKSRLKNVAHARHVAMFLCYALIRPTPTYAEIGEFFGGRDHTSVMHAVEKIRKTSKINQVLSQDLLEIENSV